MGSTGIQEPDKDKEQITPKRDKTVTPQDNTEVVPSWDYNTGQNFGLGHPNTQAEFVDNQKRAKGFAVPDLKTLREANSKNHYLLRANLLMLVKRLSLIRCLLKIIKELYQK